MVRFPVPGHWGGIQAGHDYRGVQDLTAFEPMTDEHLAIRKQYSDHACSVFRQVHASDDSSFMTKETRKQAFEWAIAYHNGLRFFFAHPIDIDSRILMVRNSLKKNPKTGPGYG